ncbi:hypothetical protein ACFWN1_05655 [Streptomyces sp. NPDC058459]|uniref:hypothetical protein n=1 Tax=Streptomyces sp. NPDC058459 TaxID=3346508 RepID=UPI00364ADA01
MAPRVWFFASDDLPEGEGITPISTPEGLALGVRPEAKVDEILSDLNRVLNWAVQTGVLHVGQIHKPPEQRPE